MTNERSRTTTAIRFPEELRVRLQQAAEERDWSMNTLVVKATEDYLERLIPIEEISYVRN